MDRPFTRREGFARGLMLGLAVATACSALGACTSPVSPEPVVRASFSLPAELVGFWHGVSARQVSGLALNWNLDDMQLRPDGSAEIVEYEGPARRFAGTWYVDLRNLVVIRSNDSSCLRAGTVEGEVMTLTCTSGSRAWSIVFTKSS